MKISWEENITFSPLKRFPVVLAVETAKETKAEVKIRAFLDSKQRVVLEVSDNGPGVDKDLADKIFVPFFTTKKEGSGVGLTLVRYIVLSHGGAITYRHGEKGGSVFRIVF